MIRSTTFYIPYPIVVGNQHRILPALPPNLLPDCGDQPDSHIAVSVLEFIATATLLSAVWVLISTKTQERLPVPASIGNYNGIRRALHDRVIYRLF